MVLAGFANPANPVHRAFIADVAAEGIAGIGRIGNQTALPNDLHNRRDPPRLRMRRMYVDEPGHAQIVER